MGIFVLVSFFSLIVFSFSILAGLRNRRHSLISSGSLQKPYIFYQIPSPWLLTSHANLCCESVRPLSQNHPEFSSPISSQPLKSQFHPFPAISATFSVSWSAVGFLSCVHARLFRGWLCGWVGNFFSVY